MLLCKYNTPVDKLVKSPPFQGGFLWVQVPSGVTNNRERTGVQRGLITLACWGQYPGSLPNIYSPFWKEYIGQSSDSEPAPKNTLQVGEYLRWFAGEAGNLVVYRRILLL